MIPHQNDSEESRRLTETADHVPSLAAIDTKGKTRAQVKAEEYERSCGEAWTRYQSCLKVSPLLSAYPNSAHSMSQRAIKDNDSLSTLLEQARDEHPLRSQEGLAGTPWDPKADFSSAA